MITKEIHIIIDALNANEVAAIPTETVYGLAANGLSKTAVEKIFELKKRPSFNPLILHIGNQNDVLKYASTLPDKAEKLIELFWPGPLTLILPKKEIVPNIVTSNHQTVAIRMPNHAKTLELLRSIDYPLAAPSANPFGHISPTTPDHVFRYFGNSIPILDGGACQDGIESTIIGFENNEPIIYRFGAISQGEIEAQIGNVRILNKENNQPLAPGMLLKHYAPKTKSLLSHNILNAIETIESDNIGILAFKENYTHPKIKHIEILSVTGNLKEAAQNLYQKLHLLDALNLDFIIIESVPDFSYGKSINDRISRAVIS
jgi:L-threonylcarbamoyladenylate synthase